MLTTGRSIGAALPTANFEYRLVSLGAFLVAPDFSPSFMFETLRQRVSLGIACLAKPHCFMSPWSLKSVRLSFCRNGWIELKGPMPLSRFGLRQVLITTHVCLQWKPNWWQAGIQDWLQNFEHEWNRVPLSHLRLIFAHMHTPDLIPYLLCGGLQLLL